MSDERDTNEMPAAGEAAPEFELLTPDDPRVQEYKERTSGPEWDSVFDIETYRKRRASSRPAS